jgi:hypothetical protein
MSASIQSVSVHCAAEQLPSAAAQSVSVHCAAEQLHCEPLYKVSQSTVPQSSYPVSRDTKCLSPLCSRAATLSAAIQSASVHCAAEQLPCQPLYKVSQSTVPQSSYPFSRCTKCLSPLCRRADTLSAAVQSVSVHCAAEQIHCQPLYKVSQCTVPQSSYPVSRDTKCLSPLCRRLV